AALRQLYLGQAREAGLRYAVEGRGARVAVYGREQRVSGQRPRAALPELRDHEAPRSLGVPFVPKCRARAVASERIDDGGGPAHGEERDVRIAVRAAREPRRRRRKRVVRVQAV